MNKSFLIYCSALKVAYIYRNDYCLQFFISILLLKKFNVRYRTNLASGSCVASRIFIEMYSHMECKAGSLRRIWIHIVTVFVDKENCILFFLFYIYLFLMGGGWGDLN